MGQNFPNDFERWALDIHVVLKDDCFKFQTKLVLIFDRSTAGSSAVLLDPVLNIHSGCRNAIHYTPATAFFFRTTLTREIALHCKTFLTDKVRIPPPHGFIILFFFPPTVTVVLWKPVFFTHPHRYIAHLNRDGFAAVTLSCEARGFPTPVISWLQDKTLLKSDSTVTQNGDTSSLTVVFTTETEQPLKYRCLANNLMGKTWSEEGEVTIIASAQRKIPGMLSNSVRVIKRKKLMTQIFHSM